MTTQNLVTRYLEKAGRERVPHDADCAFGSIRNMGRCDCKMQRRFNERAALLEFVATVAKLEGRWQVNADQARKKLIDIVLAGCASELRAALDKLME